MGLDVGQALQGQGRQSIPSRQRSSATSLGSSLGMAGRQAAQRPQLLTRLLWLMPVGNFSTLSKAHSKSLVPCVSGRQLPNVWLTE